MSDSKLSFNKLDKIIKSKKCDEKSTIKYEFEQESYEIPVKTYISFSEVLDMVDGVVSNVFPVDKNGETNYVPSVYEYTKALHYIEHFCPTLKIDMGSERVFAMLYGSDIMRTIYKQINPAQYNAIEDAIESSISNKLAMLQSGERAKISDATDKIDKAVQALEALTQQFDGIDPEKMQAAFENLSTIGPQELTEAVANISHAE